MNRFLAAAAALVLLPLGAAAQTPSVLQQNLNLRSAPAGHVLTTMPRGSQVMVQGCDARAWCSVLYPYKNGHMKGYAKAHYMRASHDATRGYLTSDLYGAVVPPFVHVSPMDYIPPTYTYVTIPRSTHTRFEPIYDDYNPAIKGMVNAPIAHEPLVAPEMVVHGEHPIYDDIFGTPIPTKPGEGVIVGR